MVIITQKKTKPRPENDFYQTPYELAYDMYSNLISWKPKYILDPGYGSGVFGYAGRDFVDGDTSVRIDGIDIKKYPLMMHPFNPYTNEWITDYTHFIPDTEPDVIIGNPPYSLAEEFVRHSIRITNEFGVIIFLLKLAFLEGKGRCRGLFAEYKPSRVYVLAGRPSFDGTGRTNDYAFAVYVWDKQIISIGGHVASETKLGWLDWGNG